MTLKGDEEKIIPEDQTC